VPRATDAPKGVAQAAWQATMYPQGNYKSPVALAQKNLSQATSKVSISGMLVVAKGKTASAPGWATVKLVHEIPGKTPLSGSHYEAQNLKVETVRGIPVTQVAKGVWVAVNRRDGSVSTGATAKEAIGGGVGKQSSSTVE
jgi:hypothetical protein